MPRIQFRVNDLPPKKRPRSKIQKARLEALQNKALEALRSQVNDVSFENDARLTLRVHIGFEDDDKKGKWGHGDLDNFVTGVCDGLKGVAFHDDKQVVKIDAEKVVGPDRKSWYEVVLEGE